MAVACAFDAVGVEVACIAFPIDLAGRTKPAILQAK